MTNRMRAIVSALPMLLLANAAQAEFREGLKFFQAGNHAQAAIIWQQDAENGEPASQRNLGLLYLNGLGVPRDPVQAARWFKAAADQAFAPAAANLADLYLRGNGVPADRRKAAQYMRIAADGGLAESQHNLGIFYEHGIGLEKDEDAAVFWYQRASAQGFQKSTDRLAALRPDDRPAQAETATSDEVEEPRRIRTRTARAGGGDGLLDRLIPLFSAAE